MITLDSFTPDPFKHAGTGRIFHWKADGFLYEIDAQTLCGQAHLHRKDPSKPEARPKFLGRFKTLKEAARHAVAHAEQNVTS